jgi:hypothetical protein
VRSHTTTVSLKELASASLPAVSGVGFGYNKYRGETMGKIGYSHKFALGYLFDEHGSHSLSATNRRNFR